MPVTPSEMVELIEAALAENPLVASVTVDGQTVQYNRAQAMEELAYWRRRAADAATTLGRRPMFRGFQIGGAW